MPLQGLDDEVAHHAAVVGVHTWAECVEDTRNAHLLNKQRQRITLEAID
jgi:hypothetical protein